jgi:hypothetical protein
MAEMSVNFRRIVLGLSHDTPSQGLRFVADLAAILQLELFGLFVEEESLIDLASLPFAREFRTLGGGWQAIEVDRLTQELATLASGTQRLFMQCAKGLGTKCQFEIVRGSMAATITSVLRGGDIVVILETENIVERSTQNLSFLVDAAFRSSAAAVMIVPRHIVRRAGPIVAIAEGSDDPSIRTAATIAAATGEELVIVEAVKGAAKPRISKPVVEVPRGVKHMTVVKKQFYHSSGIVSALYQFQERLIVVRRGAFDDLIPSLIASTRRVPVLISDGG